MKNLFLIICLLAFTGTAYAESNYVKNSSPLSVGETDKYFKDLNSWDSRNLYVPGQPYRQQYDYSYSGADYSSNPNYNPNTQGSPRMIQGSNTNSQNSEVGVSNTTTGTTTVKSTKTHRGTGYRWGKNPNEIHYNFGGTGFKSKGFGQGYGQ